MQSNISEKYPQGFCPFFVINTTNTMDVYEVKHDNQVGYVTTQGTSGTPVPEGEPIFTSTDLDETLVISDGTTFTYSGESQQITAPYVKLPTYPTEDIAGDKAYYYITLSGYIGQDDPKLIRTVSVGTTTTLPPDSDAYVVNSGTVNNLVLDFGIPEGQDGAQGPQGEKGDKGDPAFTVAIGTVTTLQPGEQATVTNTGTTQDQVWDISIPQGIQGIQGEQGTQGETGPAATVEVGDTETTGPGGDALVTNLGDEHHAILHFQIPRGAQGPAGGVVSIIAVTDTPPATALNGQKYYNTTDQKIYTWTDGAWSDPQTPDDGLFYIEGDSIYHWNGEDFISAGNAVYADTTTIIRNEDKSITAIGVKTKSNDIKYDWIGTLEEWEAGRADGTIPDDWCCYILDDDIQTLKGDTGPMGPPGQTGPQGPQGEKGDKGDPGAAGAGVDIGTIITSLSSVAPAGFNLCNGDVITNTDNPELYEKCVDGELPTVQFNSLTIQDYSNSIVLSEGTTALQYDTETQTIQFTTDITAYFGAGVSGSQKNNTAISWPTTTTSPLFQSIADLDNNVTYNIMGWHTSVPDLPNPDTISYYNFTYYGELAEPPSDPSSGEWYFDTTKNTMLRYNNGTWSNPSTTAGYYIYLGSFTKSEAGIVSITQPKIMPSLTTDDAYTQQTNANNGNCGYFGIDTTLEKVKLPTLNQIFLQGASGEPGLFMQAGLPNVEGSFVYPNRGDAWSTGTTPPFEYVTDNPTAVSEQNFSGSKAFIKFDLSTANPIYGNSTTVQPESVAVYYYVCVQKYTPLERGPYFTPSVDSEGNLSWTNNGDLQNPESVNIKGPQGIQGPQGEIGPQGPQGEAAFTIQVGSVTTLTPSSPASVTNVGTEQAQIWNIGIPQGIQGEIGPAGPRGESTASIVQTHTDLTSGTILLDEDVSIYRRNVTSNTTFTFNTSNITFTSTDTVTFELKVTMSTAVTLTFPSTVKWLEGEEPDFSSPGIYYFVFRTDDEGTTWYGNSQGRWDI